jgi:outer membrane protein, heavy metal efflux system
MIRFFVFNVCTFSCLLPAQSLDSFSAVQKAYETQPELQAALQQLKATQARSTQELRWSNPELGLAYSSDGPGRSGQNSVSSLSLSQTFPLGGRLARQKDVSQLEIELAANEINTVRLTLAESIRRQILILSRIEENIALGERFLLLERDSLSWLEGQALQGEVSSMDANTVRLDLLHMEQDQLQLRGELARALRTLAIQLGYPPEEKILIRKEKLFWPDPPPGWSLRPDVREARLLMEHAEKQKLLSGASRWGDLTIELFMEREESAEDAEESVDFTGIALSIPLPLWDRKKDEAAALSAQREETGTRLRGLLRQLESEARDVQLERELLEERLTHFTSVILPAAKGLFRETEEAYHSGHASLRDVQHARQALLALESSRLSLQQNLQDVHLRYLLLHAFDLATPDSVHP